MSGGYWLVFFVHRLISPQAGLFSAVVAGFTVDSYKSLTPPSPPDASAQLLARISLQLESFAIGPLFANSTVPSLSLLDATQASGDSNAGPVPINVNILWIISLALSLLSALYAISAQQWLRHLRNPSHFPTPVAVQLLQARYESLRYWQVPGIISLLPVILQSAVILFLVGFIILLRDLNWAAAISLGVVGGGGILLFLVAAAIPFWRTSCAYKSSLFPAVLLGIQALSYPLVLSVVLCWGVVIQVCESRFARRLLGGHLSSRFEFYYYRIRSPFTRARRYLRDFGAHVVVDLNTFWINRELTSFSDETQLRGLCRAAWTLRLDRSSFAQVSARVRVAQHLWHSKILGAILTGLGLPSRMTKPSNLYSLILTPSSDHNSLAVASSMWWNRLRLGISVEQTRALLAMAQSFSPSGTQFFILITCHGVCQTTRSASRAFARLLWSLRDTELAQSDQRNSWVYHVHLLLLFKYRRWLPWQIDRTSLLTTVLRRFGVLNWQQMPCKR